MRSDVLLVEDNLGDVLLMHHARIRDVGLLREELQTVRLRMWRQPRLSHRAPGGWSQ